MISEDNFIIVSINPVSVNDCWKGRRFKTDKYKSYERELLLKLKPYKLPEPPYSVYYEFGLSSALSDWDNPVKPFQDILQKKYRFNDVDIQEAVVRKVKTVKGKEYVKFKIESYKKFLIGII